MAQKTGLCDSHSGMIVVYVAFGFPFALYPTSSKAVTLPMQISKMVDLYNVLWAPISAAAVMQLVPMLIVVFLIQRHMIRGLALGAVK